MPEDLISGSLQENILILLVFSDQSAPLLINAIDPGLFESDVYKDIAKQAVDYYNQFKETPKEHIADLLEDRLEDKKNTRRAKLYEQILIGLYNSREQVNEKYVITQVQRFVRQQRLKTSIVDAARYVKDGDVDAAELTLERSLRTQIDVFQPGVLFRDPNQSLRFFDETSQAYKIGVKPLDNMNFGPAPGELFVILAPANRGKCIAEDTRIMMADGMIRSIREVVDNKLDGILSLDESSGRLVKTKISDHYDNGIKECLEVKTRTGRKVKVTPEHPFLTPTGWVPVTELKAGDYVAVPRQLPHSGTKVVGEHHAAYLAYMIAEGCLVANPYTFTNTQEDIQQHFTTCVMSLGATVKFFDHQSCRIINHPNRRDKNFVNPANDIIWRAGLHKHKSVDKFIPNEVFTWWREDLRTFLRILFTCDGSLYKDNKWWLLEYCSGSRQLIDGINNLLLRFGIVGKISDKVSKRYGTTSYVLVVRNKVSLKRFLTEIGLGSYKKVTAQTVLAELAESGRLTNSSIDGIPAEVVRQIHANVDVSSLNRRDLDTLQHNYTRIRGLSYQVMTGIAERNPTVNFAPYVSDDIMWDKVMYIKGTDPVHTYDLTVDTHHNFIANDMIVHNTWCMVHIGKMAVIQRLKVLHISLEMSEEKMSQRYIQSFFSLGKRQGQAQIINFRQDELGRLTGLELDTSIVRPTLTDPGIEKTVRKKLENIRGDFYIKRFPTNALTIRGLETYLDSMERYYNFVPDLLIVDYADLFKLDASNLRIATGEVYKELRRVAVERNIAVVTASQSNRLGEDAKVLSLKYLGEDYSKAATSDNVIAYCQTSAELRFGLARLFTAKARDEEREQTILISQAYRIGQFCMNAVQMHDRYWDELGTLHSGPSQGESEEESGQPRQRRSLPKRRYS